MKRLLVLAVLALSLGCDSPQPPTVAKTPTAVQPPPVVQTPPALQASPVTQPPVVDEASIVLDPTSDESLRRSWQALVDGLNEEDKWQMNNGIQLLAHRGMKELRFEGMREIPLYKALEFARGMNREQILRATAAERATLDAQRKTN